MVSNVTLPEQTAPTTYYGIPPIRHSHYEWKTAAAFFCNGVGGGSQILACTADLLGSGEARPVVCRGRHLALAGGTLSTVLLIRSLHTPVRWYNMLRIFRKTSSMSIGIWAITSFTVLSGLAEAALITEKTGFPKTGRLMGRIFGVPAALLGGIVVSYMGTELEETNTPLWAIGHPLMGPLYAAEGMSNAAAALVTAGRHDRLSDEMKTKMGMLSVIFETVETALSAVLQSRWRRLPEAASFRRSRYAPVSRFGLVGTGAVVPLLLRLYGSSANGRSRALPVQASVGKLAGALLMQFVMIYAGRESGKHAKDYFQFTSPAKWKGFWTARPEKLSGSVSRRSLPFAIGLAAFVIGAGFLLKKISKNGRKG